MRLIDADPLKLCYTGTNGYDDKAEYSSIRKMIDMQPTVYGADEVEKAMRKQTPQKVTHEATLLRCCTCPSCKNVVDHFEMFGDARMRVTYQYCHFCGQKLDWGGYKEEMDRLINERRRELDGKDKN